jgi:ketosteroid isomerase-like protein
MNATQHTPGLLLSLIALVACAPTTPPAADLKADEAAIHAFSQNFLKAYGAGDADAIGELYAEDAVLSPPDAPAVHGREAIREYWANDIAASAPNRISFAFGPDKVIGVSGDLAYESGSLSASDKSGATVYQGKFVSVYRKTGGKWHMIRDIWNSDAPPATAPAASAPPK